MCVYIHIQEVFFCVCGRFVLIDRMCFGEKCPCFDSQVGQIGLLVWGFQDPVQEPNSCSRYEYLPRGHGSYLPTQGPSASKEKIHILQN